MVPDTAYAFAKRHIGPLKSPKTGNCRGAWGFNRQRGAPPFRTGVLAKSSGPRVSVPIGTIVTWIYRLRSL